MKKFGIIGLIGLLSLTVGAQRIIEKNITYNKQFVNIEVKFAHSIEVKTWNKNTIYFKAEIKTEDGKYQDLYQLDIDKGTNSISIASEAEPVFEAFHDEWNKSHPNKKKRYYNTGNMYRFNYVIFIPKNARFKVSSINGSLKSELIEGDFTADLINGSIDIEKYAGDMDLSTINGEIDLKMINANLVAETIHGNIYADEKLKFNSADRHVGQKISGRTAEGKNSLRLNTINGNMYLRL